MKILYEVLVHLYEDGDVISLGLYETREAAEKARDLAEDPEGEDWNGPNVEGIVIRERTLL